MTNEVLIRGSLIPKKLSQFRIRYFGLVETFQHGWRYCILRVQRKNSTGNFSKHFLFPNRYRALSETFSDSGQNFPNCCQYCFLRVRGHLVVKIFFSKKLQHLFFRKLGKKLFCHVNFLPNISRHDCQKCLVHFQTNTFKEVIFLGKLWLPLFCLDFEGESSGSVVKKRPTLTEKQLRIVVFTSIDLILVIVSSLWTKCLGLWPKFFNRDVNTAISASSWKTSGETSFFRTNHHI